MDPVTTDWLIQPDGLATRLRAMRAEAGLSGRALSAASGLLPPKVSKIEHGHQVPSASDIQAWGTACAADPETIRQLLDLLGDVHAVQMDWRRRVRAGQVHVQETYNQLMASTKTVRTLQTSVVPGLLQIPDYARCVFQDMAGLHHLADDDVDDAVATRMQRQQVLYDRAKRFEFVLDQSVLHRLVCPPDVMLAQLDRLLTATELPNVRLGVVPFGVRITTAPQNPFVIYDDLVIIDTFAGEVTYERTAEVALYGKVMDLLWREAVTEVRPLILAAADRLRR